jgi:succinoglycan biosynthesis transport protein ExoP
MAPGGAPNGAYYAPPYGPTPHTTVFSLAWILRVGRRNWLYIALAATLGLSLAVTRVQRVPKRYMASSMIEMSVRRPRIIDRDDAVLTDRFASMNTEQVFNTRLQRFRSEQTFEIAREVLKEQGITDPLVLMPASFSLIPESFLVNISCSHTNPVYAALSANAFAEAAVRVMERDNRETSESAVEWLRSQATAQKAELEKAERALASFRSSHQLDLLQSQIVATQDSLKGLNHNKSQLHTRIVTQRELLAAFDEGKVPQELAESKDVQEQQHQVRAARAELEQLLTKYRPQHPEVQAQVNRVESLQAAYEKVLSKHRNTLQDTIAVLERQLTALGKQIDETQKDAAAKEVQLVELSAKKGALERELQAADMSYTSVLRRMEEARLSADEKTTAIKVARQAKTPMVPIYPRPLRSAAKGLIFGGFIGVLLAFAKDWLEDHVTSTEDVEDGLGLPALGLLGKERIKDREKLARAVLHNEPVGFAEAIAGLRTNIAMGGGGETHIHSMLITSAGVECGKTVTTCNLASIFALTGERTLLVDCDFRRPRIGRLMIDDWDRKKSLAHTLLSGNVSVDDFSQLVQNGPHAKLDVIASSPDSKLRPAYLLASNSMKMFVEWAEKHYDRVVIDSPPHGVLSDATNLSGYVSGVIIVCRHDKSRKHGIARTIRSLEHVNANLLGAVINGVPHGGFSVYDYYRGGYDLKDYHVDG